MVNEVQLYKEAGILYCKVAAGVCNLKNGLFQSNFTNDLKKLLAIVAEAIKNKVIVNEIFKRSNSSKVKSTSNSSLECDDGTGCENCRTKVQIYDMLFGQATSNTSGCPLISKMRMFKNILEEIMKENKLTSKEEALSHFRPVDKSISLPVYVRINLLLISKEAAISHFENKGFNFLNYEDKSVKYNQYLEWAKELKETDFMPDYHLHDHLLVFHPSVALHNDKLVQCRKVLIQDKASCIPAVVLDPATDMDVLDACAAPGNKTSHLLAILSQKEPSDRPISLFAFDRDETRFRSLQAAMAPYKAPHAVATWVTVEEQLHDFTKVDPLDPKYANVGYICLDPSCSGSGIMRQVDRVAERNSNARIDPNRLKSLRNFQAMLLSHALSFPSVRRVVYSTCSVTLEENETVVEEILDKFGGEFVLRPIWTESWMTRGKKLYKDCIRTNPSYDLCNGFFVACFERVAPSTGLVKPRRPRPAVLDHNGNDKSSYIIRAPVQEEAAAKKYRKRRKTKKTGKKVRENEIRHRDNAATDTSSTTISKKEQQHEETAEPPQQNKTKKNKKKDVKTSSGISQAPVVPVAPVAPSKQEIHKATEISKKRPLSAGDDTDQKAPANQDQPKPKKVKHSKK